MHSVIFQFITPEISENAFLIDSETLFDDPVVLMRSDYTYDITDKKERRRIIQETLPAIFDGIADVDVENETITITDFDKAYKIFCDWKKKTLTELAKEAPSMFNIKTKLMNYNDFEEIFYVHFCQNSSRFIEDFVNKDYGNVLKVGSIIGFHY